MSTPSFKVVVENFEGPRMRDSDCYQILTLKVPATARFLGIDERLFGAVYLYDAHDLESVRYDIFFVCMSFTIFHQDLSDYDYLGQFRSLYLFRKRTP